MNIRSKPAVSIKHIMTIHEFIFDLMLTLMMVITALLLLQTPGVDYRKVMLVLSLIVFVLTSRSVFKCDGKITTPLVFYIMVCFMAMNLGSYYFIYDSHIRQVDTHIVAVPRYDHYILFFSIYVIVSLLICLHSRIKNRALPTEWGDDSRYSLKDVHLSSLGEPSYLYLAITSIVALLVVIVSGIEYEVFVSPIIVVGMCHLITMNLRNLSLSRLVYASATIITLILLLRYRFVFAQIAMALVVVVMGLLEGPATQKRKIQVAGLFIGGMIAFLLYGVISEVYKLNLLSGENSYDVTEILTNPTLLSEWFNRQIYRIFTIWSHLAGNIIEYVDNHGFFYGSTYIASFLSLLGYPATHLPELSARLISANYAQVGLVGEGYANFGFIGGVANVMVGYLFINWFRDNFRKKPSVITLCIYSLAPAKILIDGGSINSMFASAIATIILFFPLVIFRKVRWVK